MRYTLFLSLASLALLLDGVLLGLSIAKPEARLWLGRVTPARAAQRNSVKPLPTVSRATAQLAISTTLSPPSATPLPLTPTATVLAPTLAPPSPTPTVGLPTPTVTPLPEPRLLASNTVSFAPSNPAVVANIRLAFNYAYDSLSHVVLPPGATFSFNATLGSDPESLPWRTVRITQPSSSESLGANPPVGTPMVQMVRGGGLCDLASRYVMAARPLLPSRAFRFTNHIRTTGIRLHGVPARDSVTIWAVGGGHNERDLEIRNTTPHWLQFLVEREGKRITIHARLWDQAPPNW